MIVGENAILLNRASLMQAVQRWLDATVMEAVDATSIDLMLDTTDGDLVARVSFRPRPIAAEPDHDVAADIRAALSEAAEEAERASIADAIGALGDLIALPPDCPIIPLRAPLPADKPVSVVVAQEADHG